MAERGKKVSFLFSKVKKPSGSRQPIKHKAEEDIQYIECLDSKEIVFKKYVLLLGLCVEWNAYFSNGKHCSVILLWSLTEGKMFLSASL
jgi:hypothetical protein